MKIAIVGNAGSGKSTLGVELHEKLGISLYHLDQYFWKPNWQEPDRAEFEKIHHELCDRKEWIIEGMNTSILEYRIKKADAVIFLDVSRYTCFWRIFKRALQCFGEVTFSSAKECREGIPSRKFLKFIWNFENKQKPRILNLLHEYKNKKRIFVVRSNAEINTLIHSF